LKVLSLFDGMSCGRIALDRLGLEVNNYYASEIDKNAIKCSKANWDDITHVGDVTKISYSGGVLYTEFGEFETEIDLLIGGSPCQDFSTLRAFGTHGETPQGLQGDKSGVFYHYLRILREIKTYNKDVKWLLENVKMKKENKEMLDGYLGVVGRYINSEDFSFQKRARYYWTNLQIPDWQPLNISFQSHKEVGGDYSKYKLNKTPSRIRMWAGGGEGNSSRSCANVTHSDKVYCLTTKQDRSPNSGLIEYEDFCRFMTQKELELAQTVPVGYTACLSYNQACAVLGNGWTVDVICHILKSLKDGG